MQEVNVCLLGWRVTSFDLLWCVLAHQSRTRERFSIYRRGIYASTCCQGASAESPEVSLQRIRAQKSHTSTPASVQEPARSLWEDITSTYERARASGAAYKTDTSTELYKDPQHGVDFVLRVAAALRDKPKPPKDRQALQP